MIRVLPQPLKTMMVIFLVAFAVMFVSVPTGHVVWPTRALGVTAAIIGVLLAGNINGAATSYAHALQTVRIWGVDYSKSFMAQPLFIRLFGVAYIVVGVVFVVASQSFAASGT